VNLDKDLKNKFAEFASLSLRTMGDTTYILALVRINLTRCGYHQQHRNPNSMT